MITGKMPVELFPELSECQSSEDAYYTQHRKYKIFPNIFLVNADGSKPATAITNWAKAMEIILPINHGILINDPTCRLVGVGSSIKTTNYIEAEYVGRLPLSFYGPKTKAGEHFKLAISNGNLDIRTFAKEEDLNYNSSSRNKTMFYSEGD